MRAFLNNRSGCRKKLEKSLSYLQNLSLPCLKRSILETITDIAKNSRRGQDGFIRGATVRFSSKDGQQIFSTILFSCCTLKMYSFKSPFLHRTKRIM